MVVNSKGDEHEKNKVAEAQRVSPGMLLFIGSLLVVLAYLLYPLRAISMLPGILIGGGVVGLIWITYKVIYLGAQK